MLVESSYIEMADQVRVGPRVLIPATFPASQRFLEMRGLGEFPSHTVFAVMYAFIEAIYTTRSRTSLDNLLNLLQRISNIPHITIAKFTQEFASNQPFSILQNPPELHFLSSAIAFHLNLTTDNDYSSLAACTTLCQQLNIKGTFYFLTETIDKSELNTTQGTQGGDVEVHICGGRGRIYELYTVMSGESFVHLYCGHVMLRYELLGYIVSYAWNYTVSPQWTSSLQLGCMVCSQPLQPSDIAQVFHHSSPVLTPGNCRICRGQCHPTDKCSNCEWVACVNCKVKQCCLTGKPFCRNCSTDFLPGLEQNGVFQAYYSWLQRVLSISMGDYFRQKQHEPTPLPAAIPPSSTGPKPCSTCEKPISASDLTLCPNQCYCYSCDYEYIFSEEFATPKCRKCKSILPIDRLQIPACTVCQKQCPYQKVVFSCLKCNKTYCWYCVTNMKKKDLLQCAVGQRPHWISDEKLKKRGKAAECVLS